jgi:hypothetical protein
VRKRRRCQEQREARLCGSLSRSAHRVEIAGPLSRKAPWGLPRLDPGRSLTRDLGPANMDISDAEFESMLNQARVSLIRGLLPAH